MFSGTRMLMRIVAVVQAIGKPIVVTTMRISLAMIMAVKVTQIIAKHCSLENM